MRRILLALVLCLPVFAQQPAVFRIQPVHPVEQLRREALAAEPPMQISADFYAPALVELVKLDPTIKLDIRYATTDNFLSSPMYEEARAFLQKPAAEALLRVSKEVQAKGYGLLIHDAYRPWYITKMFWDGTPADKHNFVADPAKGSIHNRGCAVDITLYDLKTGKAVSMPSLYDEMTERSYPDYKGGTDEERQHRQMLREAMERQDFKVYEYEWWHFNYKDWQHYPIMNLEFAQIPDPALEGKMGMPRGENAPDRVTPPKRISGTEAEYTDAARRKKIKGRSASWMFIGTDGSVKQVIDFKPLGYGLDESTINAFRQWKFTPATYQGKPVPVMVTVESNFDLY